MNRDARFLAALFCLSFLLFLALFGSMPVLFDSDSSFHMAVARRYLAQGFGGGLPWARFSLMHEGFGDKDFLFHVLLIPFAALKDPMSGGFVALAALNAGLATMLAAAVLPAGTALAAAVPLLLYATASNFTIRCLALRPEVFALLLLIAAGVAVSRRRFRLLGLLALLYTLSYTAFHVLFGLCVLWFLAERRRDRTTSPAAIAWPAAGICAGVLLHPHFPLSLRIWFHQNFSFFANKSQLDVGTEFLPPRALELLLLNGGWALGLGLILLLSRWAAAPAPEELRRRRAFAIAAAFFCLLLVFMQRFSLYVFPLATLALLQARRPLARRPARAVQVGAAALALATLAACGSTLQQLSLFLQRSGVYLEGRRADWEAIGPLLPAGARVAAPWVESGFYVLWAPQALYLNVLDPLFMALRDPDAYREQRLIFAGGEPDVPLRLLADLQSDYLVFSLLSEDRRALLQRLAADPRIERLKGGINPVYALRPGRNAAFVLDWELAGPAGGEAGRYPRRSDPREAALEGYVDARRLPGPGRELTFVHRLPVATPARVEYELSSFGPFTLLVDGREAVSAGAGSRAVLGKGAIVRVTFTAGTHTLAVRVKPQPGGQGFYLRELSRTPLESAEAAARAVSSASASRRRFSSQERLASSSVNPSSASSIRVRNAASTARRAASPGARPAAYVMR
jgi:hypothetical protein